MGLSSLCSPWPVIASQIRNVSSHEADADRNSFDRARIILEALQHFAPHYVPDLTRIILALLHRASPLLQRARKTEREQGLIPQRSLQV